MKKYNVGLASSLTVTIPGADSADSDRRRFVIARIYFFRESFSSFRQKALKALNDRLKPKDNAPEAWPEMDEVQQTPLLPPTHQNADSAVRIDIPNLPKTDNFHADQTST